jgi:outer membrane immunogenic protein
MDREAADGENAMKKFLFATVGLAGLLGMAAPASAADMAVKAPPPPVVAPIYSWAGLYIGGNGGWGTSHKCWDVNNFRTAIAPFREGCHDADGGTVGGQIGYRWQASNWVFGLEAQGNWADLNGSNASVFVPRWTNNSKIEAFGLFTGQVGYAWNNVLWYVKGGAAVTSDKYRGTVTATGAVFDATSETRWGAAVGTGLEFGFAPNWSVAIEYDHLFMGHRDLTFTSAGVLAGIPAGSVFRTDSIRQDVDMVTARINYRFGGPLIGRY